MVTNVGCGGCAGPLITGGYFLAKRPPDVKRLVFHSGRLQEIELAFDLPVGMKFKLEKRFLELHSECGCNAASLAVILALITIIVMTYLSTIKLGVLELIAVLLAVTIGTKILSIVLARFRIALMAHRLSSQCEQTSPKNGA